MYWIPAKQSECNSSPSQVLPLGVALSPSCLPLSFTCALLHKVHVCSPPLTPAVNSNDDLPDSPVFAWSGAGIELKVA